ncbi:MAG: glutathione S-transferase family protein [Pseudomonadota bacterium]
MTDYRLTCFAQSGNAYKAALYFALGGIEWTPVWINFFKGAHKEPEYLAKNEYGQVPILEHGDVCVSQSGAILDYLAAQEGEFAGADDAEKREILRWILWDNYGFTSIIAPYRFIGHFVPEEKRDQNVLKFLGSRLAPQLKILDQRLATRDFVASDGLSIADLSIVGYLYYGEELPFDLSEHANIAKYLERISNMPGFQGPYDLMPTSA